VIVIVLSEYRNGLIKTEKQKPVHQRRPIPTILEMAKNAGISKTGLIDIMNNRYESLNIRVMNNIITQFRKCGFDTDISDVVKYVPEK